MSSCSHTHRLSLKKTQMHCSSKYTLISEKNKFIFLFLQKHSKEHVSLPSYFFMYVNTFCAYREKKYNMKKKSEYALFLTVYAYMCLPIYQSVCLSVCLSIYLIIHPSICQSVYLFLSIQIPCQPNVYLSILFIYYSCTICMHVKLLEVKAQQYITL